jgi:hypothetical protein
MSEGLLPHRGHRGDVAGPSDGLRPWDKARVVPVLFTICVLAPAAAGLVLAGYAVAMLVVASRTTIRGDIG